MLNFIGIGSAFNTELGNNSAFMKNGESMLLIDCGGMTFSRLLKMNVFHGIKNIYIVLTHTHSDHVGSLGDIILYSYYVLGIKVKIYFPEKEIIRDILKSNGVSEDIYEIDSNMVSKIMDHNLNNLIIEFRKTVHVDTIPAYGFFLENSLDTIYYSGDSCQISDEIVKKLKAGKISKLYQDTSGLDYEGNKHLPFKVLEQKITEELRNKVYCMHLDQYINYEEIIQKGFQVVTLEIH